MSSGNILICTEMPVVCEIAQVRETYRFVYKDMDTDCHIAEDLIEIH